MTSEGVERDGVHAWSGDTEVLDAHAKLTLNFKVTGRRPDGYHLIDAEMTSVTLCDTLELSRSDTHVLEVSWDPAPVGAAVPMGSDNLVIKALDAVGTHARVRLVKRIPIGGGLGGGSSDAAAVLRWAGHRASDPASVALAASLGADVPFCLTGGSARVGGIGDEIQPAGHLPRAFVLLTPPFGVSTPRVYAAFDELQGRSGVGPVGHRGSGKYGGNDLEPAALVVEPRLSKWRDLLGDLTGREPHLAGSGSTWFVEVEEAVDATGNRSARRHSIGDFVAERAESLVHEGAKLCLVETVGRASSP